MFFCRAKNILSMEVMRKNEPLRKHTTFRIGGAAGLYYEPTDKAGFLEVYEENRSAFILGGGSNVLVSDKGLPVVISMKGLKSFSVTESGEGNTDVKVGAGYGLTALTRKVQRLGLAGLEFAFGIPGSVGGAIVMNAGASGGEVEDVLLEAELLSDGKINTVPATDLKLAYRESSLPKGAVILSATLRLGNGEQNGIMEKMNENNNARKASQPLDLPSAGSIFKNPQGDYAGRIIEELGFKGKSVGGAMVSEKHANFIVNTGDATAGNVLELVEEIEAKVKEEKGISLTREIRFAGSK